MVTILRDESSVMASGSGGDGSDRLSDDSY